VQSWKDPTGTMMMNGGGSTEIEMILNVLKYASTNVQSKKITYSGFATLDGTTFFIILCNHIICI
jgi:hypothetical protein